MGAWFLAHAGEPLGPAGDAAPPLTLVAVGSLLFAYLPTLLGLALAPALARMGDEERASVDGLLFGALLFLFADFLSLTANLGTGAADLIWRGTLLVSFVAAVALFALLERAGGRGPERLAVWWAVGVGLHAMAEGVVVGHNLTLGLAEALRPLPLLSFSIHKFVEGLSVAALLARGAIRGQALQVLLASVASVPLAVGAVMGAARFPGEIGSIFYALGAGSVAFILPAFIASRSRQPAGWSVATGVGFLFIAVAALLHEL